MMAVSASGASSEPLASWVRYVPVGRGEKKSDPVSRRQRGEGWSRKIKEAIKVNHWECRSPVGWDDRDEIVSTCSSVAPKQIQRELSVTRFSGGLIV